MSTKKKSEEKTVEELLLESGVVKFSPEYPFRYKKGLISPFYCDTKSLFDFSMIYPGFVKPFQDKIYEIWQQTKPLSLRLAAVDGATCWAALCAWNMVETHTDMYRGFDAVKHLPFCWVLQEARNSSLYGQIEGAKLRDSQGNDVIIIENVIKTGGSTLDAIRKIRLAGGNPIGVVAILSYDLPSVKQALEEEKVPIVTLTTVDKILTTALEKGYLSEDQAQVIDAWHQDPENWGK